MTAIQDSELFKALSDPNRIRIVEMLARGETCACRVLSELDISQPTLSHHMTVLQRAGLVVGRKDGQWVHYSLVPEVLEGMSAFLSAVASDSRAASSDAPSR